MRNSSVREPSGREQSLREPSGRELLVENNKEAFVNNI